METVAAAFFDEEWEQQLSKLFSIENSDFLFQLQGDGGLNDIFPFDPIISPSHNHVNQFVQSDESMHFLAMDQKDSDSYLHVLDPNEVIRDTICSGNNQLGNVNLLHRKREFENAEEQTFRDENPKKRTRVSRNGQKKNKRNANSKPKKNENNMTETIDNEEKYERNNTTISGNNVVQSSSCCSSEDDSTAFQDLNITGSTTNGKTTANRGAATDPQSLYARRRRERINERLRILQSLVPNGTKVDISTMLEEAVNYVKFLQLQIKLLSSDDMWMYAPIAYNGMDIIGLHQKILPTL